MFQSIIEGDGFDVTTDFVPMSVRGIYVKAFSISMIYLA